MKRIIATATFLAFAISGCGVEGTSHERVLEFHKILPLPLEKVTRDVCEPLYFEDMDIHSSGKWVRRTGLMTILEDEPDLFTKQHYLAVIAKCEELKGGDAL